MNPYCRCPSFPPCDCGNKKRRCVHGISGDCEKCKLHNLDNQIKSLQRSFNEKCESYEKQIDELSRQSTESLSAWNMLEDRVKDIEYRLEHIVELPSELDIRLDDVERKLDKLAVRKIQPHKCPVCDGRGRHFLHGLLEWTGCDACESKGIVWNQN